MKLFYICVLFFSEALIASAQPIMCNACWAIGSTKCCEEKPVECSPNSRCMIVSEYCKLDGKEYQTVWKGCGDDTTCDKCFSVITERGIYVEASSRCGVGNYSNADLGYNRSCDAVENGRVCPTCYANNSMEGCNPDGQVKCKGDQIECVNYAATIQLSTAAIQPTSLQGCITKNGCDIGFVGLPGARELKRNFFNCTIAWFPE